MQRRKPKGTAFEIVFPVLLFLLLAAIRTTVNKAVECARNVQTGALLDPDDRAQCEFEGFKPAGLERPGSEFLKCSAASVGWR